MLGKKIRKISTAGKLRKLNLKHASPLHGNGQQVIRNSLFNISTVQACNNFVPANRRTDGTASQGSDLRRDHGLDGLARKKGIGPIGNGVTGKPAKQEKQNKKQE